MNLRVWTIFLTGLGLVVGCSSLRSGKYVGFWAGGNRTHGAAMLLEKGGTGQAATVIGLLPLRWSVEDNGLLSVRYSAGDGFVIYEKYEPNKTSNTLDRVSYRSVCLNEDRVEREDNVRVALSRHEGDRGDWDKGVAYLKEGIEKAKEHAAKQRARQPEHEESEMIVRTDDDLRAVAMKLDSGWGVAFIGSRDGLQAVNVHSSGVHNEVYSISVFGGEFVVGDETDEDFWPVDNAGFGAATSVPKSARVKRSGVSESSLMRFRSAMKGLGAAVREDVYSKVHMFYIDYRKNFIAAVSGRSSYEILSALMTMLKEESQTSVKVMMWRQKPQQ